jgi:hypothetical protein
MTLSLGTIISVALTLKKNVFQDIAYHGTIMDYNSYTVYSYPSNQQHDCILFLIGCHIMWFTKTKTKLGHLHLP